MQTSKFCAVLCLIDPNRILGSFAVLFDDQGIVLTLNAGMFLQHFQLQLQHLVHFDEFENQRQSAEAIDVKRKKKCRECLALAS